ncbi:hypothetical protein A5751_23110 [Mycolicibacterium fortuitum]|nr:hypothetical protein A5751_23110 [Mycolicibacterium fortuitum]
MSVYPALAVRRSDAWRPARADWRARAEASAVSNDEAPAWLGWLPAGGPLLVPVASVSAMSSLRKDAAFKRALSTDSSSAT